MFGYILVPDSRYYDSHTNPAPQRPAVRLALPMISLFCDIKFVTTAEARYGQLLRLFLIPQHFSTSWCSLLPRN